MKLIEYKELYKELMGLYRSRIKVIKIINQIRNFNPELKKAFYTYFKEKGEIIPKEISFHGVTLTELIEKEGMNPIRAFLMLDWICKNPRDAMEYMASYRFRSPMSFSSDDLRKIEEKLKEKNVGDIEESIGEDRSNIEVDEKRESEVAEKESNTPTLPHNEHTIPGTDSYEVINNNKTHGSNNKDDSFEKKNNVEGITSNSVDKAGEEDV